MNLGKNWGETPKPPLLMRRMKFWDLYGHMGETPPYPPFKITFVRLENLQTIPHFVDQLRVQFPKMSYYKSSLTL